MIGITFSQLIRFIVGWLAFWGVVALITALLGGNPTHPAVGVISFIFGFIPGLVLAGDDEK